MATQTTPATQAPPQFAPKAHEAYPARDAAMARANPPDMSSSAHLREPGGAASPLGAGLVASGGLRRARAGEAAGEAGLEAAGLTGLTPAMERLPVEMTVAIPVRQFRVRDLLAMVPGAVIETQWTPGEDLPLASGEVQLAWSEFEVVDTRLAVRVTRLG